jgi:hypothetical protein
MGLSLTADEAVGWLGEAVVALALHEKFGMDNVRQNRIAAHGREFQVRETS